MNHADPHYQETLKDGYILRWGTDADRASLEQLYGTVFGEEHETGFNHHVVRYVNELLSGSHPHCSPDDFAVVTEPNGRVVAATILMRMNMEYAGTYLHGGRPEIVASYAEVRNRGFVRKIFGLIHARSEQRGDVFQGITGIPYYYKQFGYEYAVTLGGSVSVPASAIPVAPMDEDPFSIRPAQHDDIMQLQMLYERERSRMHERLPMLATSHIDARYWRWAISGSQSHEPWKPYMIINRAGEVVGSVGLARIRGIDDMAMMFCNTEPHIRLAEVYPSLLRAVFAAAQHVPTWDSRTKPCTGVRLVLGVGHPFYALVAQLPNVAHPPYAWYIRVADLVSFVGCISAVLEKRLSQSVYAGYSGNILFDFYRGGLQLTIQNGRISAQIWPGTPGAHAAYPPNVFLQQLFGIHSLEELTRAHMDVRASGEHAQLLGILFPKQTSWLAPLD
jgi:hypothetical protein